MQAGFDGLAEGTGILLNETMTLRQSAVLAAQPSDRKTVATCMGSTTLAVPRVRGDIRIASQRPLRNS